MGQSEPFLSVREKRRKDACRHHRKHLLRGNDRRSQRVRLRGGRAFHKFCRQRRRFPTHGPLCERGRYYKQHPLRRGRLCDWIYGRKRYGRSRNQRNVHGAFHYSCQCPRQRNDGLGRERRVGERHALLRQRGVSARHAHRNDHRGGRGLRIQKPRHQRRGQDCRR